MGWLAIGLIAGAFLFGVLAGALVLGLCQMARVPRERGALPAQLDKIEPNNRNSRSTGKARPRAGLLVSARLR